MPRLTVTFDPVAAARLDRLAGGRNKSDVIIREALALEEVFQKAMSEGPRWSFVAQTASPTARSSGPELAHKIYLTEIEGKSGDIAVIEANTRASTISWGLLFCSRRS